MNVGETGNFISYAFAPASVVAPLGTVIFLLPTCGLDLTPLPVCFDSQLSLCSIASPRAAPQSKILDTLR